MFTAVPVGNHARVTDKAKAGVVTVPTSKFVVVDRTVGVFCKAGTVALVASAIK